MERKLYVPNYILPMKVKELISTLKLLSPDVHITMSIDDTDVVPIIGVTAKISYDADRDSDDPDILPTVHLMFTSITHMTK